MFLNLSSLSLGALSALSAPLIILASSLGLSFFFPKFFKKSPPGGVGTLRPSRPTLVKKVIKLGTALISSLSAAALWIFNTAVQNIHLIIPLVIFLMTSVIWIVRHVQISKKPKTFKKSKKS